jgi:hypothetical protein
MTVAFGAIGTGANGSTTVAPSFPAGITAGQMLLLHVTSGATNSETPTTPSGWTFLATGASTDGTYGVDAGPRRATVFCKLATGSESGTQSVSITNGGTCRGSITRWTCAANNDWRIAAQGANDSTSGTGVSMTTAAIDWATGDCALVAVGQRVDSATQSAQSLTASGTTFGTRTNRATVAVTTGNDHRHVIDTFAAVTTGGGSAATTWAYTASAAASAGGVIVRLREVANDSITESAGSTDTNTATVEYGGAATESSASGDNSSATVSDVAAISESGASSDSASAVTATDASVTESAGSSDTSDGASVVKGRVYWLHFLTAPAGAVTESGTAGDSSSAVTAVPVLITEDVGATEIAEASTDSSA